LKKIITKRKQQIFCRIMNQQNQRAINVTRIMVEQYRREKTLERINTSVASNDLITYILKEQESDPLVNEKLLNPNLFDKKKDNPCICF